MSTTTTNQTTSYTISVMWQGSAEIASQLTATLRADAGFTDASAEAFAQSVFQAAIAATGSDMILEGMQYSSDAVADDQTTYTVNPTTGAIS